MHATIDQLVMVEDDLFFGFASDFTLHEQDFNYSTITTDLGNAEDLLLCDIQHDFQATKLCYRQKNSELKLVIYKS